MQLQLSRTFGADVTDAYLSLNFVSESQDAETKNLIGVSDVISATLKKQNEVPSASSAQPGVCPAKLPAMQAKKEEARLRHCFS